MCEDVLQYAGRLNQDARLLFLGELVSRGERARWYRMRACMEQLGDMDAHQLPADFVQGIRSSCMSQNLPAVLATAITRPHVKALLPSSVPS